MVTSMIVPQRPPGDGASPTAWHEALTADRPVVLEAIVDPDVPPLPRHVTVEQAASMTKALLKGDPDAAGVVRQSMRGLAAGVTARVPH
jgi:pyruvate dehydrogenase (quinone)